MLATTLVVAGLAVPSAAAASGDQPLRIMVVDTSQSASSPFYTVNGAKAAVKALNKAGTKIQLDICDSSNTADINASLSCVREAISNKDAAFIGTAADDGVALLEQAKIPVFAPNALSAQEYNNPISYQVTGGVPVVFGALGASLVNAGAKKVAVLGFDIDAAKPLTDFAKKAVVGSGGKIVTDIAVPFQAVDVSSQVQQLKDSGAKGVVIITTEDIAAMLVRTIGQLGAKVKIAIPASELRQETMSSLGSLMDGMVSGDVLPHVNVGSKNPASVAQFIKEMKAVDAYDTNNTGYQGMVTWINVHAIGEAMKAAGNVTDGASLIAALDASKGLDLPIVGKWVPSATGPFSTYSRLSNGRGFFQTYSGDGTWATVKPVDGVDVFALIAKAGGTK
jgi:ABC-type branched-subunit amino acid transport system substrate-binding protein